MVLTGRLLNSRSPKYYGTSREIGLAAISVAAEPSNGKGPKAPANLFTSTWCLGSIDFKTNTLYSPLQSLKTVQTNIMTAEDPVEFNLMGINQVQMKAQICLSDC